MQTRAASAGMARSTRGRTSSSTTELTRGARSAVSNSRGSGKGTLSVDAQRPTRNKARNQKEDVADHKQLVSSVDRPRRVAPLKSSSVGKAIAKPSKSKLKEKQQTTRTSEVGDAVAPRRRTPGRKVIDGSSNEVLKDSPQPTDKQRLAIEEQERGLKRKRDVLNEEISSFREEKKVKSQELKKMKISLEKLEANLTKREEQLDEREACMQKKELELDTLATDISTAGSEKVLKHLEDSFTCALCFDILACPQSLSPSTCGHTFCALCILKWFFSHLHRDCNEWHDSLECPLCRASLPFTHQDTPRSVFSCPFTPNRLVDSVVTELLNSLDLSPSESSSSSSSSNKKQKQRKDADTTASPVTEWHEGGSARLEWKERDRRGRAEMLYIVSNWRTLQGRNFKAIKDRL